MPSKIEEIPTLSGLEMDNFHFDSSILRIFQTAHSNVFHVNRIEDIRDLMKFPLAPHRKTVFDFIFLTSGSSIRSKGLDTYEFSSNTFFFLPPYQISSHDFFSPDGSDTHRISSTALAIIFAFAVNPCFFNADSDTTNNAAAPSFKPEQLD